MAESNPDIPKVLNQHTVIENLYFYQKSDVIYQLAFAFCDRFIHLYKDRTRDQVIQAARSGKQNFTEGMADGMTSTEMQLKLINVGRSSLQELREDFEDYIKSRHLRFYQAGDPEFDPMLEYCRRHNRLQEYESFFPKWTDEQMCNYGITLCRMVDKMVTSYLERLEKEFVTMGGIRERMHRARTGYRQQQDERLKQLEAERPQLEAQLQELQQQKQELQQQKQELQQQLQAACNEATQWEARYNDLKERALKAYYQQQNEIEELKKKLEEKGKKL